MATLPGEPKANSTFDDFGLALRVPYAGVRLGRFRAKTPPFHSTQNAVLRRHEHDHSGFSETRWYAAVELRWDAPKN